VISTLQQKLDTFRDNLQLGITVTAWIFTIIFVWLGIAQVGLLTQGLERVNRKSNNASSNDSPPEENPNIEQTALDDEQNSPE
jgi:hypothetical protein